MTRPLQFLFGAGYVLELISQLCSLCASVGVVNVAFVEYSKEDMPHEQIVCILENARKSRLIEAELYRFYSYEYLDPHIEV